MVSPSSPSPQTSSPSKNVSTAFQFKWDSLFSGCTSGALTQLLLHPLDSVKVRLQAHGRDPTFHRDIGFRSDVRIVIDLIRNEGWRALYQGTVPALYAGTFSWGAYFFLYNSLKDTYLRKLNAKQAAGSGVGVDNGDDASRDGIQNNLPTRYLLLASGQAGLLTSAVTHPIWMIKTRMQLQKRHQNQTLGPTAIPDHLKIPYRSTQDGIRQIIKHEGLPALYTGFLPTVLLVSHGMIHFVLYDELKRLYSDAAQKESQFLNTYESFIISGSAKLVAALTTYPLQVVKTRLQDPANLYGSVRYTGMLDVLRSMYRNEGLKSFFRGISAHVIRVSPTGALAIVFYEQTMRLIHAFDTSDT